jgi:hypothetical protein
VRSIDSNLRQSNPYEQKLTALMRNLAISNSLAAKNLALANASNSYRLEIEFNILFSSCGPSVSCFIVKVTRFVNSVDYLDILFQSYA